MVQSVSALGLELRPEMCSDSPVQLNAQPRDDEYHSAGCLIYTMSTFCTFYPPSPSTPKRQAQSGFSGSLESLYSDRLERAAEKG